MNTEQQLRERAEAMLKSRNIFHLDGEIADAMLDFHKQELQRIGEVIYVPVEENNNYEIVNADNSDQYAYLSTMGGQTIALVKKLPINSISKVTVIDFGGLEKATIYGRPLTDFLLPDQIERLKEWMQNNK